MMSPAAIAEAFRAACAEELSAPKAGNVHVFADGHGMAVRDFLRSAEAAAPALCRQGAKLGERVLDSVRATRTAVGQNTNLGIILLAAPLVMAAERSADGLRFDVCRVLQEADVADSEAIFRAIRHAAPAGLGEVPQHDVHGSATVVPLVAMAAAAPRDSIARQWVTGFADVFGGGMDAYRASREAWPNPAWAPLGAYLWFLAATPDSHILRKHGSDEAERTRREAIAMKDRIAASADPTSCLPALLDWDSALKARGVNPGTSADLTAATVLAYRLGRADEKNPIDSSGIRAG